METIKLVGDPLQTVANMDIFDLLAEQQEPINVTIGRLRIALIYKKPIERQLELLDRLSERIIEYGVIHPEDIL